MDHLVVNALRGNVPSQMRVAELYEEGRIVPQNKLYAVRDSHLV